MLACPTATDPGCWPYFLSHLHPVSAHKSPSFAHQRTKVHIIVRCSCLLRCLGEVLAVGEAKTEAVAGVACNRHAQAEAVMHPAPLVFPALPTHLRSVPAPSKLHNVDATTHSLKLDGPASGDSASTREQPRVPDRPADQRASVQLPAQATLCPSPASLPRHLRSRVAPTLALRNRPSAVFLMESAAASVRRVAVSTEQQQA